jgi:hypothetical protein
MGELATLKQLVAIYPERMRHSLVYKHLFDAQFEIEIAAGPAARGDVAYVSQCIARATGFMVLVLYALNQRFFLNEKDAFIESQSFELQPPNFHREVEGILGRLGSSPAELNRSVASMRAVAAGVAGFCELRFPIGSAGERRASVRKQFANQFGTSD